jgi:HEAT repeat protein
MADAADPQRLDAMAELVGRGDDEALGQALQTLEDPLAGPQAASTLLSAIERSHKKAALPRLRELLEKSPDKVLRIALIHALTGMKDDKALGTLVKLSEDKEETVARAATEAIVKLAGKAQLDLLKKASAEGEGPRRLEAAEALLQLDRPEGFEGLKAELESGKSYNRLRAVQILQNARRKESVDLLITLLEDPDAALRKQAQAAVLAVLEALFPYSRFDAKAPPEKLKAWWAKNRPK